MDDFTFFDFEDTNFLNTENASAEYLLPDAPNPSSIIVSDQLTHPNYDYDYDYYLSTLTLPPPSPPPLPLPLLLPSPDQPWPHLEEGEPSTHPHLKPPDSIHLPKVVTSAPDIPTQDQSSKDIKSDLDDHEQAKSSRKRHSASQKKQRNKVKEKTKELKDLIPNCDKADTAFVLEKAIKHIQTLKTQSQWYNWYEQRLQQYSQAAMGNIIPQPMIPTATGMMIPYLHYQAPTATVVQAVQPNPVLPSLPPTSQAHGTAITTTVTTVTPSGK